MDVLFVLYPKIIILFSFERRLIAFAGNDDALFLASATTAPRIGKHRVDVEAGRAEKRQQRVFGEIVEVVRFEDRPSSLGVDRNAENAKTLVFQKFVGFRQLSLRIRKVFEHVEERDDVETVLVTLEGLQAVALHDVDVKELLRLLSSKGGHFHSFDVPSRVFHSMEKIPESAADVQHFPSSKFVSELIAEEGEVVVLALHSRLHFFGIAVVPVADVLGRRARIIICTVHRSDRFFRRLGTGQFEIKESFEKNIVPEG